jgi:hypothetical protein
MRRSITLLIVFLLTLNLFGSFYISAEMPTYSIDSILISQDGCSLSVNCTVPKDSQNKYYLFRILSENENISNLTPVAEGEGNDGNLCFNIKYDSTDHSSALYGYCLGTSDGKNGYFKITKTHYINNLRDFSHNTTPFPAYSTKKGLEIQYITDAQILGISHTVIHVYLNDFISESSDSAYTYVYGDLKYYINTDALTLLDYRVKTLTAAGINVYINFLLAFDQNANDQLYYPNANGNESTLFAPNISDPDCLNRYAAVIHLIAQRYTSGEHGFCGNYIIGYEVNNQADNHSAGISSLYDYVNEYGRLLRISHLALTSAYSNARLFVSVSNRFNIPVSESKQQSFGSKEFLDRLFENYSDIPFGIAINPYPSSLSQTDFWNDTNATDSINTEYVTMKNIGVFTEYVNSFTFDKYASNRSVVITEFGVSGVKGEESETLQAAAYAYAFLTAENDPYIEAFIWHRHVDHISEINLSYGIYSSTDIILDAGEKKLIHDTIYAIDNSSAESKTLIEELLQYLPSDSINDLMIDYHPSRVVNKISAVEFNYNPTAYKKQTLFDFSKNLYSFYPTDNTEYIDLISNGDESFMRIATLLISDVEYMGAGAVLTAQEDILSAEYISVRIRVVSHLERAEFVMVLSEQVTDRQTALFTSSIETNKWVTLTFTLDELKNDDINVSTFKLWVKSEGSENEQIFLDVSNVKLLDHVNNTHITVLTIIISAAFVCVLTSVIILLINRYKGIK